MTEFDANKYVGNPPSITRRMREKIALCFLILLITIAVVVVTWFFSTANTFTVVATKVDDRVGTMEHYTTIVYAGIRTPDNISDASDNTDNPDQLNIDFSSSDVLFASDIREAYRNKGSDVMTLDVSAIKNTESPSVYYVGSKKIGFFYIDQYASVSILSQYTTALKAQKVDVIICITKRSVMLGSFEGIDCVLCTEEKSPSEVSEGHIGNCLIARAAEIGSIGTLRISNSNLVSDKIYTPTWKLQVQKSN